MMRWTERLETVESGLSAYQSSDDVSGHLFIKQAGSGAIIRAREASVLPEGIAQAFRIALSELPSATATGELWRSVGWG